MTGTAWALSALATVSTGSADVGMVYATPIVYLAAVIQASTQPEAARTFIEVLQATSAQTTFNAFGFGTVQ